MNTRQTNRTANLIKSSNTRLSNPALSNQNKNGFLATQTNSIGQLSVQFKEFKQNFDREMCANANLREEISKIQNSIAIKSTEFEETINSLKCELQSIKQSNEILTKCIIKMLMGCDNDDQSNPDLHQNEFMVSNNKCNAMVIKQNPNQLVLPNDYNIQCNYNLSNSFVTKQQKNQLHQSEQNSKLNKLFKQIGVIENSIQCLEAEINKTNSFSSAIETKYFKMNHEIHVISAKYIEHSAKINLFLQDFKRKNRSNDNIESSKYVDKQALNFIPSIQIDQTINANCDSIHTQKGAQNDLNDEINTYPIGSELFCSADSSTNHLPVNSAKNSYSRTFKIKINNTCMINLDSFSNNFVNTFNFFFGRDIVKNITISKYAMLKGLINQIEIFVCVNVPLSCQYINCIKFPSNWQFFHVSSRK